MIKDFCEENGYKFINLIPLLVGEDGYCKQEYIRPCGDGFFYSNAGTKVVGDSIMEALGLPKPYEAYPDWYKTK
ncbi:MAG TPA: hypothetical protein PLZ84_04160 [Clostridia bacterium]|nr:hypothetical protein [Clostridia bacterium]